MPWKSLDLEIFSDVRGSLSILNIQEETGILFRRVFWIKDVEPGVVRGEHAHRTGHQVLVCISGALTLTIEDVAGHSSIEMSNGSAVWMKPMTWASQKFNQPETTLLVLASNSFDPSDYIHDKVEFLSLLNQ